MKDGSRICTCTNAISGCSIHPNTPEGWIYCMQASLARMLASPAGMQVLLKAREVACSAKSSAWLMRYDRNTSSWRTSQESFDFLDRSSEAWPKSGMMQGGYVWALRISGLRMAEKGGGVLQNIPTPSATMAKGSSVAALTRKNGKSRVRDRLDHFVMHQSGGPLNPVWVEWLMGWPIGWTG